VSIEQHPAGYLLDTHTVIWALHTPEALTASARNAILSGPNVLSVITYWEVVLKSMKGTLDVGDPRSWWQDALEQLVATPLPLSPRHVASVCSLPSFHKDPFDRMLIAQAASEGLAFVSMDGEVARYASANLRIVG
jgi:PIN domain nuclease of toxin-antitoxin system